MPSFRKHLLTVVSELCQKLFERRLALVREQQLVPAKSKEDIHSLIVELDTLRHLNPFPTEGTVDQSGLEELRTALDDPDFDPAEGQELILQWVRGVDLGADAGAREELEEQAMNATASPLNQRMIDDLHRLREEIDKARIRLLRSGDRYDGPAYTTARNAFTLARSVYVERLRLGQVDCTNEEVAKVEQELMPAFAESTGASFPGDIQAAADFIESRVFPALV